MSEKQFAQAKVTRRKQIALPEAVRKKIGGVEEGDYILFFEDGDRIYIGKGTITLVK
jgi:AbrB family looped-hinge helix DNA binding protein